MDSALSPREIQSRIRGGATLTEVATEAGVEPERIEGFALPVLAEREHMTNTALECAVRRRGDGSGHRRLQELISTRLQARGIDSEGISWDSWSFTMADNPDARWMIGEEIPGSKDPDNENTVDFDDEFALVRATTQPILPPALPGDDVPTDSFDEGPATSELDDLYDMLSGVSEDSVRIYVGLDEDPAEEAAQEGAEHTSLEEDFEETEVIDDFAGIPEVDITETVETSLIGSPQDSLIDTEDTSPQPRSRHRRRARVPSWDEIMFGGPAH